MKARKIITSVAALALVGGASGLALAALPQPERTITVPIMESAGEYAQAYCPGGFERTLGQGVNVTQVDEGVAMSSWFLSASSDTEFLPWSGLESPAAVTFDGASKAASGSVAVGSLQTQQGTEEAEQFAGASIYSARAGDTRGLAIGPCLSSAVDLWFVGSASGVGTSNQLLLFNPGHTPVAVNLTAHGSTGPLSLGTAGTVAIAPDSMERVDLDGVIPADSRIALHVSTETGEIAALLQTNEIEGVKPRGVSFISGSGKGRELFIPAVAIPEDPAIAPSVRLVNPESAEARVSVELVGSDGSVELAGGSGVVVAPGAVLDLSLAGVKPGNYGLRVTSERAIAAGALLVTPDSAAGARDVAWASARELLTSGALASGETTTTAIVTSMSDTPAKVEIIPVAGDGAELEALPLTIEGQETASVGLPTNAVGFFFSSSHPVLAGAVSRVELDGGEGIEWSPAFTPAADEAVGRIAATN